MATSKPTAAPADAPAVDKTFVGIFTPGASKGVKVELFRTMSDKPRAPLFDGNLDGKHVSAFLRQGKKGPFLSIVGDGKDAEGKSEQVATANVVTRASGSPALAITMADKTTVFASISKKVDDELLVKMGLNVEKQAEKRAAAAKAAASEPAVPAKKTTAKP